VRGAWSRKPSVLEIGDVSEDEALEYLKLQDVNDRLEAQIYKLVGRRMVLLDCTAYDIQSGSTLDGMSIVSL
jgi:hypothetical protein